MCIDYTKRELYILLKYLRSIPNGNGLNCHSITYRFVWKWYHMDSNSRRLVTANDIPYLLFSYLSLPFEDIPLEIYSGKDVYLRDVIYRTVLRWRLEIGK